MRQRFPSFLIFLLVLVIAIFAYFLGKRNGTQTIDNVITNHVLVQQIAELSTLEVRGVTSIRSSNITDDGSLSDSFRKLFTERTLNISVPYIAKYGIDLNKQNINIEAQNKQVYIVLPNPKLLSYELLLDKADAVSRKGLLETSDEEMYNKVIQKLYDKSKSQFENNQAYKQQAKEKITKILDNYYTPMGFTVDVTFKDELKSKIIDATKQ